MEPSLPRPERDEEVADGQVAARRREAVIAGHIGDEQKARALLEDPAPVVRAGAIGALVRMGRATADDAKRAVADTDPLVRRRACELAAHLPGANFLPLLDDVAEVVEVAAFALGEIGDLQAVPALIEIARAHADPLCRESAIAALGAIGDERAKEAIIGALDDAPAIRRRAVVALSAFEGEEVISALTGRLDDRDWQVRQAAADVLAMSEEL